MDYLFCLFVWLVGWLVGWSVVSFVVVVVFVFFCLFVFSCWLDCLFICFDQMDTEIMGKGD